MDPKLELALVKLADDNLGIYPQAIHGKGGYEKRTDWMEGWNACIMERHKKLQRLHEWFSALSSECSGTIGELLCEKKLQVYLHDEVVMAVNCNDTFYWGCSDCEDITVEELSSLIECYKLSPKYGGELWCARKRGMRPQTASYVECYPSSEWHLFDAAGPERDDPDGKGRVTLQTSDARHV